jgi:hypothetical protein
MNHTMHGSMEQTFMPTCSAEEEEEEEEIERLARPNL